EKAIVDVVGQLKAKNHPLGTPAKALIDYVKLVVQGVETVSIVRGDAKSYHIAAASIVAKVHRDRLMQQVHTQYPHYGFLTNVGYGSKQHRQAIQDFGICPLHRHTFVKKILAEQKVGV
ncbi:MAG: ribonuclease HII, partial [Firmicutes bacterium]|nr:ribonuclease HII [Bacillota bacterium]